MVARLLLVASIEALVNEVLWVNFPDESKRLTRSRVGLAKRLNRLCELLEIATEAQWLRQVEADIQLRNRMVHHRPGYEDEAAGDEASLALGERTNPEAIARSISAVDECLREVFGAAGLPVFQTHRPFTDGGNAVS